MCRSATRRASQPVSSARPRGSSRRSTRRTMSSVNVVAVAEAGSHPPVLSEAVPGGFDERQRHGLRVRERQLGRDAEHALVPRHDEEHLAVHLDRKLAPREILRRPRILDGRRPAVTFSTFSKWHSPWAWLSLRKARRRSSTRLALRHFFVGLSSPESVHWRPTVFMSFGSDTLGMSRPISLPRTSRIFAFDTLKSLVALRHQFVVHLPVGHQRPDEQRVAHRHLRVRVGPRVPRLAPRRQDHLHELHLVVRRHRPARSARRRAPRRCAGASTSVRRPAASGTPRPR